MLTTEQLQTIKARYDSSSPDCPVPEDWPYTSEQDMRVYRDMDAILAELDRLTRDNEHMQAALSKLASSEHWEYIPATNRDGNGLMIWGYTGLDNPQLLASKGLGKPTT